MNNILIHKKSSLSKIYMNYFIALIPLIIYGIYKNGILLYIDGSISFINVFKPLLLPIIGGLSGLFVHFVINREFKFNPLILYGLIVGMIVPISTNILIFLVAIIALLFLSKYLEKYFSFNTICFVKLIIVGFLLIFKMCEYANVTELAHDYAFSFIDIIFGRGIGGISSSSIILIIVGYIYLLSDYYYKKEIPLYGLLSYILVILISYIFIKDFSIIINNIFASSVLFTFVFIAPMSEFSPYTPKGKLIFGISIGVLSALFTIFIGSFEASIIAILIVSIANGILRQKITK